MYCLAAAALAPAVSPCNSAMLQLPSLDIGQTLRTVAYDASAGAPPGTAYWTTSSPEASSQTFSAALSALPAAPLLLRGPVDTGLASLNAGAGAVVNGALFSANYRQTPALLAQVALWTDYRVAAAGRAAHIV